MYALSISTSNGTPSNKSIDKPKKIKLNNKEKKTKQINNNVWDFVDICDSSGVNETINNAFKVCGLEGNIETERLAVF